MPYYFIKTSHMGSTGDLFKAKNMDEAALKAAKKWPRADRLFVWTVQENTPFTYTPETEVAVVGVRQSD